MIACYCYDCRRFLVPMDMHKINSERTWRGRCKDCHRAYSRDYSIRMRAKVSPHNFMECDECDRIFSKYEPGSAKLAGKRLLRTECPFCKSEEIDSYKPENKTL